MFATSEEQLVMHNEGKKHKRTVALKELTHGHLAGTPTDSAAGQLPATHCIESPMQSAALSLLCKRTLDSGSCYDQLLLTPSDTTACSFGTCSFMSFRTAWLS